jgi:hypothetical protein
MKTDMSEFYKYKSMSFFKRANVSMKICTQFVYTQSQSLTKHLRLVIVAHCTKYLNNENN